MEYSVKPDAMKRLVMSFVVAEMIISNPKQGDEKIIGQIASGTISNSDSQGGEFWTSDGRLR
jgi:hypothetical protein